MGDNVKTWCNRNILHYITAFFMPDIFLFYLFHRNADVSKYYELTHIVVLAVIFSITSVLIFFVYRLISKNAEGSLIVLLVSWIFFWTFITITDTFLNSIGGRIRFIIISMLIIIAALLWVIHRYKTTIQKCRDVLLPLEIAICILFAYNFAIALYTQNSLTAAISQSAGSDFGVKTEFKVDDSLPNPDIYWFHMDSMMGFNGVEKYFNDKQTDLKAALAERGFVVNERATLNTGHTRIAVPALLSPYFYDSYLGAQLKAVEHIVGTPRNELLYDQLEKDGIYLSRKDVQTPETIHAFRAAGHTGVLLTTAYSRNVSEGFNDIDRYYTSDDVVLSIGNEKANNLHLMAMDISILLNGTPMSIVSTNILRYIGEQTDALTLVPEYRDIVEQYIEQTIGIDQEKCLYRYLHDTMSISSPKFIYITSSIAHSPYNKIYATGEMENPYPKATPHNFQYLYMSHYKYASIVMLNAIDMILDNNPDAVIVIQGDHGINTSDSILSDEYSDAQLLELNYSVISAVRIPQKYGEINEPVAPLNISRMLVNMFVGENYSILTE